MSNRLDVPTTELAIPRWNLKQWLAYVLSLPKRNLGLSTSLQMFALAIPALLCSALLTLPQLLFQTPLHREYFFFWNFLQEDPIRWFAMITAALCALIALGMPLNPRLTREDREDDEI